MKWKRSGKLKCEVKWSFKSREQNEVEQRVKRREAGLDGGEYEVEERIR